jgi:hypothetical protein
MADDQKPKLSKVLGDYRKSLISEGIGPELADDLVRDAAGRFYTGDMVLEPVQVA